MDKNMKILRRIWKDYEAYIILVLLTVMIYVLYCLGNDEIKLWFEKIEIVFSVSSFFTYFFLSNEVKKLGTENYEAIYKHMERKKNEDKYDEDLAKRAVDEQLKIVKIAIKQYRQYYKNLNNGIEINDTLKNSCDKYSSTIQEFFNNTKNYVKKCVTQTQTTRQMHENLEPLRSDNLAHDFDKLGKYITKLYEISFNKEETTKGEIIEVLETLFTLTNNGLFDLYIEVIEIEIGNSQNELRSKSDE